MPRILTRLIDLICLPGKWFSWLVLPLMLAILLTVVAAIFGWTTLIDWPGEIFLFGQALTVNSLTDIQWYIFSLIVLFGGVWALRDGSHVSVDVLAMKMTGRQKAMVQIVGDLLFLLPFCAITAWYGWGFAETAWSTGEGSSQGGLGARWLIKGALPVAFALLGLLGLLRGIGTAIVLLRGEIPAQGPEHSAVAKGAENG
ncbi:TRAP transporter small permease subunit [Paracoccus alkanivorans]|uniref:TRAP transporter small permease protein n=1 Tax=Paracoccus alkanivorans TaxID=2116655 RepID=A0A3M0MAA5_9RHOB|nr:TRAP transporter small permease subunit [Paracoccus alkanivorans]RMC34716.1 hypothetical protein C9E81_11445 [Paracoccus alkanivorans]